MAVSVHADVVSASGSVFSGLVEMLIATASEGEIGITPRHAPLLTGLVPGPIRIIKQGGKEEIFYLAGGYLEVQPNLITVLADTAVHAETINEALAQQAREKAKNLILSQQSDVDYSAVAAELARAVAQIRTVQKLRKRTRGRGA